MCNIVVDLQRATTKPGAAEAAAREKAGAKQKATAAAASTPAAASASAAAPVAPGFGWTGRCIGLDALTVMAHIRSSYPDLNFPT